MLSMIDLENLENNYSLFLFFLLLLPFLALFLSLRFGKAWRGPGDLN
jgi:hypothetical protein